MQMEENSPRGVVVRLTLPLTRHTEMPRPRPRLPPHRRQLRLPALRRPCLVLDDLNRAAPPRSARARLLTPVTPPDPCHDPDPADCR